MKEISFLSLPPAGRFCRGFFNRTDIHPPTPTYRSGRTPDGSARCAGGRLLAFWFAGNITAAVADFSHASGCFSAGSLVSGRDWDSVLGLTPIGVTFFATSDPPINLLACVLVNPHFDLQYSSKVPCSIR